MCICDGGSPLALACGLCTVRGATPLPPEMRPPLWRVPWGALSLPLTPPFSYQVIEGLGLTPDQFIDVCILCGCDYCDSIKGIGPVKVRGEAHS